MAGRPGQSPASSGATPRRRSAPAPRPRRSPPRSAGATPLRIPLEHRHALHVRRVREHVDRAGRDAAIAGLMHQQAGVARERGRVAADVDDALRRRPALARTRPSARPAPWRARTRPRAADRPATCRPCRARRGRRRVSSNRLRASKRVCASRPLSFALSSARSTSVWLPSMPSTVLAIVASGSVKLPRPQNQSMTRLVACCTSSRRSARPTSTVLIWWLTCVKSVGLNGMRTPNSGSV